MKIGGLCSQALCVLVVKDFSPESEFRTEEKLTHDIGNYRPYQTTFQKTKIFGEVKEVLEENSP